MLEDLIDDDFWALIEPLLPTRSLPERRSAGRPGAPDRAVFSGIVFVLRAGIPWNLLPLKLGCGTGAVCCRRLVAWQEAGVWPGLIKALVGELQRRGRANEARAIVDSLSIRSVLSGDKPAGTLRATGRLPPTTSPGKGHSARKAADGAQLTATPALQIGRSAVELCSESSADDHKIRTSRPRLKALTG
jgi:transposase